jgi:hypothetical protein
MSSRERSVSGLVNFAAAVFLVGTLISSGEALGEDLCCNSASNACSTAKYEGSKVALVVGSDDYSGFGSRLESLKNAKRDAATMATLLHSQGFSVRCVFEPTVNRVRSELSSFDSHLREQEDNPSLRPRDARAVLYFAGHGFNDMQSDYLVFRTNESLNNQHDYYDQSRISLDAIGIGFSGLRKYDVIFIFDACRSLKLPEAAPGRGEVTGRAFQAQKMNVASTQYYIAYSTSKTFRAIDKDDQRGAINNGLFVTHLKYFLELKGFSLNDIFNMNGIFVSKAASEEQQPLVSAQNTTKAGLVWRQPDSSCRRLEGQLWNQALACGNEVGDASCHRELCSIWTQELRTESDIGCLRDGTFQRLGDLAAICPVIAAAGYAKQIFATRQLASATVDQLRSIAYATVPATVMAGLDAEKRQAIDDRLAQLGRAPQRETDDIRDSLMFSLTPSVSRPGLPLQNLGGLSLKYLPAANAGFLSTISPRAALELDCVSLQCGDGWVGVRANEFGQAARGWLRVDALPQPAAGPRVSIRYEGEDVDPDTDSLMEIEKLHLELAKRPGAVVITAVREASSAGKERLLAESRLMFIRSLLLKSPGKRPDGRAINPSDLVGLVLEVEDKGDLPDLVIDVAYKKSGR